MLKKSSFSFDLLNRTGFVFVFFVIFIFFLICFIILSELKSLNFNLNLQNEKYLNQISNEISTVETNLRNLSINTDHDIINLIKFADSNEFIKDIYLMFGQDIERILQKADAQNDDIIDNYKFDKRKEVIVETFRQTDSQIKNNIVIIVPKDENTKIAAILDLDLMSEVILKDTKNTVFIDKLGNFIHSDLGNIYFIYDKKNDYKNNNSLDFGIDTNKKKLAFYITEYSQKIDLGVYSVAYLSQIWKNYNIFLICMVIGVIICLFVFFTTYKYLKNAIVNPILTMNKELLNINKFSLEYNDFKTREIKKLGKNIFNLHDKYSSGVRDNNFLKTIYNLSFKYLPILVVDAQNGKILDCSKKAIEFYGYKKDEMLRKYIFDIQNIGLYNIFNTQTPQVVHHMTATGLKSVVLNYEYYKSYSTDLYFINVIEINKFSGHNAMYQQDISFSLDSPVVYLEIDTYGTIKVASHNILHNLGYESEKLIKNREKITNLINIDLQKLFAIDLEKIVQIKKADSTQEFFKMFSQKQSQKIVIYLINVGEFDSYFSKYKHDIKLYEEQESLHRFMTWSYDKDTKRYIIPQEIINIVNFNAYDTIRKESLFEIFSKNDAQIFIEQQHLCEDEQIENFEFIAKLQNLEEWVEIKGKKSKDKDFYILGTMRFVTANILKNKELDLIYNIFNHSKECMVITDENFRVLNANSAFVSTTGYGLEEIKNNIIPSFEQFLDPQKQDIIVKYVSKNNIYTEETTATKKQGTKIPVDVSFSATKDSDGNIRNYVVIFSDISTKKAYEEELSKKAYFDTLTKIANREFFLSHLKKQIQIAQESGSNLALIYFDLDGFKYVNDNFGHYYGDCVLVEIAKRSKEIFANIGFVARMGGDEFAAYVTDFRDKEDLERILFNLLSSIRQEIVVSNKIMQVGASIGVTLAKDGNYDIAELINQADSAMYRSKKAGKNRFIFCDLEQYSRVKYYNQILSAKDKFDERDFFIEYQPVCNSKENKIVGFEALIRLRDGDNIIYPNDFLNDIKEKSWFNEVSIWVIKKSLSVLNSYDESLFMSVNIPLNQLVNSDFFQAFNDNFHFIGSSSAHISRLRIEVSDILSSTNIKKDLTLLNKYDIFGVKFIVDDFNENMLEIADILPINEVKIDKKFSVNLFDSYPNLKHFQEIVSKLRELKKEIVIKHVEDLHVFNVFTTFGIGFMQGDLIGKPIKEEQISLFLHTFERNLNLREYKQQSFEFYEFVIYQSDKINYLTSGDAVSRIAKVEGFDYFNYRKVVLALKDSVDNLPQICQDSIDLFRQIFEIHNSKEILERLLDELKIKRIQMLTYI